MIIYECLNLLKMYVIKCDYAFNFVPRNKIMGRRPSTLAESG